MTEKDSFERELSRANIKNLTAFWTACGTSIRTLGNGASLHISKSWPWRVWFDFDHSPSRQDLELLLEEALEMDGPRTLPKWPESGDVFDEILSDAGFAVAMRQKAMVASMEAMTSEATGSQTGLDLRWVTDPQTAAHWTRVASESFGYAIDERVIVGLIGAPGCHLLVADVDGAIVGTGLLMKTGRIAGIHMIGVPPSQRRKGFARQITVYLLAHAQELGCEHSTLQASAAGEGLYRQLGFESQGTIRSFRKTKP